MPAFSNWTTPPQTFNFNWTPARLFYDTNANGAWFDPSDMTTLFQDAAMTIPVTASGQLVGAMRDKSGRNNHVYQTDNSKRPTFTIDANDLHSITFANGKFLISNKNVPFSRSNGAYLGIMTKQNTNVNDARMFVAGSTGSGSSAQTTSGFGISAGGASEYFGYYSGNVLTRTLGTGPTPLGVYEATIANNTLQLYANGVAGQSNSSSTFLTTTGPIGFGVEISSGAPSQSQAWQQYIGEIYGFIYIGGRVVTAAEMSSARSYQMIKTKQVSI